MSFLDDFMMQIQSDEILDEFEEWLAFEMVQHPFGDMEESEEEE